MYVTGMEVKRGRRDLTDRDTYDKLQCRASGSRTSG